MAATSHANTVVSIRKRDSNRFIAYRYSTFAAAVGDWLAALKEEFPKAYVQFEPFEVVVYGGRRVKQKHILWIEEHLLAQYHQKVRDGILTPIPMTPALTLEDYAFEQQPETSDFPLTARTHPTRRSHKPRTEQPNRSTWNLVPETFRDGLGREYKAADYGIQPPAPHEPDEIDLQALLVQWRADPKLDEEEVLLRYTLGRIGIERYDNPAESLVGYRARIQRNGIRRSQFFNDEKLGGRLAALDAAITWRRGLERELKSNLPKRKPVKQERQQERNQDRAESVPVNVRTEYVEFKRRRGKLPRHEVIHAPCVVGIAIAVLRDMGVPEQSITEAEKSAYEVLNESMVGLRLNEVEHRTYMDQYYSRLAELGTIQRPRAMGFMQVIGDEPVS